MLNEFEAELGWNLRTTGAYIMVYTLIAPFSGLTVMFGAITLGQLFHKARVLMAIVCYIGISVIISLLASVFQGFNSMSLLMEMEFGKYMNGTLGITMVINLVVAVILYFVSHYIISKKLNME